MLFDTRQAGVLLHPTSLPSRFGIGDLGREAIRFLDWMSEAGFSLWQVLPLGPTGYADSPYQCFSAFAGNPYLISPDGLREEGLLSAADMRRPSFPEERVDYGPVIEWKMNLLDKAHRRFRDGGGSNLKKRFEGFKRRKTTRVWLDDFALFMAIKKAHGGAPWDQWEPRFRNAREDALEEIRAEFEEEVQFQRFCQFVFFDQWAKIRQAASERGIRIVGDIPIYVAYDSADTWSHQDLFKLRADGKPTHVAGVPPDYFSATGQLWGNPIYRYEKMKASGYAWWIDRMRSMLELVDVIRLDHFRGFEAYWEVGASEKTAVHGQWVPGPRESLFDALEQALGKLPIIAENLGVITQPVEELRHRFGLPGMKVLQFAWGAASSRPLIPDPDSVFQPHKIERESVVYTGTHDNPTTRQWWKEFATPSEKKMMMAYLNTDGKKPEMDLARAGLASTGNAFILPMQDVLGLGGEARMNFPGKESGNWCWRMRKGAASKKLARRWRELLLLYDRHREQHAMTQRILSGQDPAVRARKP